MKGTKEFYEMQNDFERMIVKSPIYLGCKIERAPKEAKYFYENGKLNDLFYVFMMGVGVGKLIELQSY